METVEIDPVWEASRDGLLEQLIGLMTELEAQEEGASSSIDLLDHLDGTRRAIDRISATITDKYLNPTSVEFFSPAVTRPLSTATDLSNSSSEQSLGSVDSHLTQVSSPTTLISEYDDEISHRRRLLDEDDDVLIGRSQLEDIDEEGDDTNPEDSDERFERLSLLLTSVLKEANEAIRDYETIQEEAEQEEVFEAGSTTSRCESRLSTAASTTSGSVTLSPIERNLKSPLYSLPHSLHSQETIRTITYQPPTAPPTPPPVEDDSSQCSSRPSISSLQSSMETIRPILQRPQSPEEPENVTEIVETEVVVPEKEPEFDENGEVMDLESPRELSLEYLLGDYLNEVIMDVRRSEFVGARFWIFLLSVTGMWMWMWLTNAISNWGRGCACNA